jgi:hypothetical protein
MRGTAQSPEDESKSGVALRLPPHSKGGGAISGIQPGGLHFPRFSRL